MGVKKTTAQEAAEKIDDLDLPESIRLDLPDRLKAAAAAFFEQLDEQPYWQDIDDTTRDDVFFMLRSAIENGTSIRDVAKSLSSNTDYADYRARRIARTEIGGAMNAGHEAGIRALADESGLPLTKEWLSVMGPTTRAAHAEADGQEVGADDLFLVDDENTPYPGHWSMSAGNRINCQCTVISGILSEALDSNPDDASDAAADEVLPMEDTGSEDARWMDELSDEDDRRRQLLLVDTGEDDADEATLAEQQQAELDAAAEIAAELQQKLEAELAETIAQATEEANSQIDKPPKKPGKEFEPDKDYNPDQPRDELGRWTDAGGASSGAASGEGADNDKLIVLGPEDEVPTDEPAKPASIDDEVIVLGPKDEVALDDMDDLHIPQVEGKPPLPNPIDDEVIVLTEADEVPEDKPVIVLGPADEVDPDGLIVLRDDDEEKPKKKPPRVGGLPG